MYVLLVGGGRAGRQMLELTRHTADIKVVGLVELRADAPGAQLARELRIPVYSSDITALAETQVDLVIDLTGSAEAATNLASIVKPPKELLSGRGAGLLYTLLVGSEERRRRQAADQAVSELEGSVKALDQANGTVNGSLQKLGEVMRRMQVVSLNAGIEAAKAGAAGKGFGVIAEEMARMTAFATQAVDGVQMAAKQTADTLDGLKGAQARLRELA